MALSAGLFRHGTFRTTYRMVWTAVGTFAPLTVLCVASAGLVTVLYRSRKAAVASPRRYPCTRVTVTVTAVVLTFIVSRSSSHNPTIHSVLTRCMLYARVLTPSAVRVLTFIVLVCPSMLLEVS